MHVSESSGDITAVLRSSSSEQERRNHQQSDTRVVKVLPVSQLAPSPSHGLASSPAPVPPLKQSARAKQLGDGLALRRPWLEKLLPSLGWMKAYKWRESLKADAVAGVTVGTMLIPQAMSYAKLAGLHPIYGRCADETYIQLAILLALMVGLLECCMGLIRLGWLIRFISHSIISGFTTGSAIIIGLSQAKNFLGYEVTGSRQFIPLVRSIIAGWSQFKWQPFTMGCVFLMVLLIMKHLGKNYKQLRMLRAAGPLTAVFFGTLFVKLYHPDSINVVGSVPRGLPGLLVNYDFSSACQLLPTAALIQ